jgi:hypothetical protein
MARQRDPWAELISGSHGPAPRFLLVVVCLLLAGCIANLFEETRPWVALARLSPAVWEQAETWRLVTFGFVGAGALGPTTVLQIACIFWLGSEICTSIGPQRARILLIGAVFGGGLAATGGQVLGELGGLPRCAEPFEMMQGQRIVLAVSVAAFAAGNRQVNVTRLRLLYGLAIPSRWLIPLQLGWALIELGLTRDFGGFVGLAVGTLMGWWGASSGRAERARPEDH